VKRYKLKIGPGAAKKLCRVYFEICSVATDYTLQEELKVKRYEIKIGPGPKKIYVGCISAFDQ
jgi:hypothetical protein